MSSNPWGLVTLSFVIDLDHVSFGTHDALATARRLRRDYGATAVFGEALPEFRYLALYLGTAEHGGFLELLDPNGPGFMTKFLERFGEAPHHLTFTVPDIEASVQQVKELGFTVTGENFTHESWREAFIAPHPATGCVIQLAQTPHSYPTPSELLATNERDLASCPPARARWITPGGFRSGINPQGRRSAGTPSLLAAATCLHYSRSIATSSVPRLTTRAIRRSAGGRRARSPSMQPRGPESTVFAITVGPVTAQSCSVHPGNRATAQ